MTFVLAALAGIGVAEVVARMAAAGIATRMGRASRRALATVRRAGVSDHWKERVLLHSARVLFIDSVRLALGLGVAAAIVGILALMARPMGIDLTGFLATPLGLVYVTGIAAAYALVRRRGR